VYCVGYFFCFASVPPSYHFSKGGGRFFPRLHLHSVRRNWRKLTMTCRRLFLPFKTLIFFNSHPLLLSRLLLSFLLAFLLLTSLLSDAGPGPPHSGHFPLAVSFTIGPRPFVVVLAAVASRVLCMIGSLLVRSFADAFPLSGASLTFSFLILVAFFFVLATFFCMRVGISFRPSVLPHFAPSLGVCSFSFLIGLFLSARVLLWLPCIFFVTMHLLFAHAVGSGQRASLRALMSHFVAICRLLVLEGLRGGQPAPQTSLCCSRAYGKPMPRKTFLRRTPECVGAHPYVSFCLPLPCEGKSCVARILPTGSFFLCPGEGRARYDADNFSHLRFFSPLLTHNFPFVPVSLAQSTHFPFCQSRSPGPL